MIESDGDTQKDFYFTVTLSDTSINGQYGDMKFRDGVVVFTLKHGESVMTEGMPDKVCCEVKESNHNRYTVISSVETGAI